MLEDLAQVVRRIGNGERLIVAGDEGLLAQLPRGEWIGGTIPYFMTDTGVVSREQLFVTAIPGEPSSVAIKSYDADCLEQITADAPENGYTLLIIPFGSPAHYRFARESPSYSEAFLKPVIGWISGVHLDELGKKMPLVFNGSTGENSGSAAVALHASLPASVQALVGTINIFRPGVGDALTFDEEGFSIEYVLVNGQRRAFVDYLAEIKADPRWPMVADYFGTNMNVSFQTVDRKTRRVELYAPVFKHVTYRLAAPLTDGYDQIYGDAVRGKDYAFSCSCILNFLYGELEGKPVTGARGAVTFGEIAHQLLNQTTVYLELAQI